MSVKAPVPADFPFLTGGKCSELRVFIVQTKQLGSPVLDNAMRDRCFSGPWMSQNDKGTDRGAQGFREPDRTNPPGQKKRAVPALMANTAL